MRTLRAGGGPALVGVAALNVIAVAVLNGYDWQIGPLHLFAHDAFKPLQYMAAAFVVAWLLKRRAAEPEAGGGGWPEWVLPLCVAVGCLPTAFINFLHQDWTQAHIGASVRGWQTIASWFVNRQVDGSYRPLGFCSLWLDYLVFRSAPVGYHLQNIGLHALNVALAAMLFGKLGFSRRAAGVAALLFAIAPVGAEPVTWPAARYDLLATFFALGALISAADWLGRERAGGVRLALVALLTAAAILSKETGYAVPLLVGALVWWRKRTPAAPLLIAAAVPAAICIAVRLTIYHGMGGYAYTQGTSPAVSFSAKAAFAVVTRLLVAPFAVDTAGGITIPAAAALVLLAAATFLAALWFSRPTRLHATLVGCAILSAVPVAALLGWIGPSMGASRYLYFPSIWIFAVLGQALSAHRMRPVLLLFALGSITATASNVLYYRDALTLAEQSARTVQTDVQSRPGIESVCLVGVPSPSRGVVFYDEEVLAQVRARLQRNISVRLGAGEGCTVEYRWSPQGLVAPALLPAAPRLISALVPGLRYASLGAMPSAFILR